MTVYLDTSVVLRRILNQPGRIQNWGQWGLALTCELTRVEARRVIDRMRIQQKLRDTDVAELLVLLAATLMPVSILELQPALLERAAQPFPTTLGTLDAIHLASAMLWRERTGEDLTFFTHDLQLAVAAQACGLAVVPR